MRQALPAGYRAIFLDEVGSTNAFALERAAFGEPSGLWVVAARQTAGRGRRGRVWTSEPGNLYATLLLGDGLPDAARFGELPLVVALAVHDAVLAALPPPLRRALAIKWPNDILFGGAKLCGILIEGSASGIRRAVAVGIGVNCAHHPDTALYPATDLAAAGVRVAPQEMFALLAQSMAVRLAAWKGGPFAPLRAAWLDRACGLGEPIAVRLHGETREGVFDGLDDAGRLLLRRGGRIEAISAGDVFFPAAAGNA